MKNKSVHLLKHLVRGILGFLMLSCFLSSFVSVKTDRVAVLEPMPQETADFWHVNKNAKKQNNTAHFRSYEWWYEINIVHYNDGTTDTIIQSPGTPTLVLKNVLYIENLQKIQDSWMQKPELGLYYGDWVRMHTEEPNKKERKIELRPLGEFKPERPLVLATVPLVTKKKITSGEYFDKMREISKVVDFALELELFKQATFWRAKEMLRLREGKPKLRSLLAYATYRMCGGKEIPISLWTLQEAHHAAWYIENWLIDGKKPELERTDLQFALARFRQTQEGLIAGLPLSEKRREILRQRLAFAHMQSVAAQSDNMLWGLDMEPEKFLRVYQRKCEFLDLPYAFSFWSGGFLAKASPLKLKRLWHMGVDFGKGLQFMNDFYDISPHNPERFADLRANVLTYPLLRYLGKTGDAAEAEIPVIKAEILAMTKECREKVLEYLEPFPDNEGKQLLVASTETFRSSKLLT
jgi:geranylgeranyl pyrophosphate synthase